MTRPSCKNAVVAILEDDSRRAAAMSAVLGQTMPTARPVFFEDAGQMLTWLAEHLHEVALISLDHDLPIRRDQDNRLTDCGTGRQVADWLAARPPACPVIVHSSNEPCAAGMIFGLQDAGWACMRVYPRDDLAWISEAWAEAVTENLMG